MPEEEPLNPSNATPANSEAKLADKPKVWSRFFTTTSFFAAAAAIATMFGALGVVFTNFRDSELSRARTETATRDRDRAVEMERQAERAQADVIELRKANASLNAQLERATKSGTNPERYSELKPMDRHFLDELKASQDRLQGRLTSLENVLLATPEKALAVPMLKQQIDTVQDRTRGDLDSVRGEIGRLFTLTQWFIGLMFTIALGVFGLALGNLKRGEKEKKE